MLLTVILLAGIREDERTKSFQVRPGETLKVNVNPGEIVVNTWEKNEVLVKVEGIDEEDLQYLEIEYRDDIVYVTFESGWAWSSDADFELFIPQKFNVELKSTGGDIQILNNIEGEVRINTAGGDITTKSISGEISFHTSGGDIKSGDFIGEVKISTQGGDIETGSIKGGKRAKILTYGGDIKLGFIETSLELQTYGGTVSIKDSKGDAKIVTYGGNIRAGNMEGDIMMNTYGGNIIAEKCLGSIEAETAGGNIRLKFVDGEVSAKTASGNITLNLKPSKDGRSELQSSHGRIILGIIEGSSATIKAEISFHGWWDEEYRIDSDFEAESYNKDEDMNEINAVYKINGGGHVISLYSVNSGITLYKK